ncbi:MAG: periplasmic heavy metal sensor [Candidatus Omnitrophota bacterium]
MKRRFTKEIICAVIFGLIFLPGLGFAQISGQELREQVPEPAGQEGEEIPLSKIADELSLSPEQKEQLKEQRFQARYSMIENRNKIKLKELELRHELEKEAVNQEVVNKIVAELKQLHGNTIEQRVDSILKMKEILTPEQFEKLESVIKHRRMQRGNHQAPGAQKKRSPFWKRE